MDMLEEHPQRAYGYASRDSSGFLSPFHFTRRYSSLSSFLSIFNQSYLGYVLCILIVRANGEDDITLQILYCGISHSDLHILKNHHGLSKYPIVPG